MQNMEIVPFSITDDVLKLCKRINTNDPVYISVIPEKFAIINECFKNVENIVNSRGGERINGWAIWKMANILIEAEAHSVWKNEKGDLIDITPHVNGEKRILFLPDDKMEYKGENIDNVRMALTESVLVKEYIELNNEYFKILQQYKPHEIISSKKLPSRFLDIHKRLIELNMQFHTKVGKNDKCPCGSGMKYKKCCGK